ncbi:thioredoxin domain-containing protein [Sphingobacterium sp. IITKGP-BTPF85]|uniref:thioredoxin domain-containing protein n=1 Tax=Sphingobacterium sp. IITKGP-BTPF85 TaxID=1338009 RepID=UPI00041B217C|nr:hypothetical protein L950_0211165 [Sphingobacterium sp. IITKGP-BTPF85]
MKKILLFLLILPFAVIGQEKGITFEHGLNWSQIKEKAKKENKFIFVDLFTTWCGPCKYMSASVFSQTKWEISSILNLLIPKSKWIKRTRTVKK